MKYRRDQFGYLSDLRTSQNLASVKAMNGLPNIKFLLKVRDGGVFTTQLPSQAARGEFGIIGGWKTYQRHQTAGFVEPAPTPSPGHLGYVKLTEMGERALVKAGHSFAVTRAK